jgi:hypothetical protein
MKKVFLLSAACFFASMAFSQVLPYVIFDGEDSENRNPWWNVGGITVEVVDWLQKDGTNAADPNFGATIWRNNDNDAWAGGGITLDLDISAYYKISVDVSKRVEGEVQVELQDGEVRAYLKVNYEADGTGEWQTLVFDLPEDWTHLTALLVAPHNVNTTDNPIDFTDNENHRMSWDNVTLYSGNAPTALSYVADNSFRIFTQDGGIRIAVNNPAEVKIYNLSGILLNRQPVVNEITIPLNSGIYFVKAGSKTAKVAVK